MSAATDEGPSAPPERKGFYVHGWVLAAIGAVVLLAAAVAIGFAVGDEGHGNDAREGAEEGGRVFEHHGGGGHRGIAIIILLILIAAAITAAVLIARRISSRADGSKTSAEEILAERFARGEIDEADYLSRRAALRS
jgi:putative membrane protein